MFYKVSFGDVTSEQSAVAVYMFLSALAFIGRIVLGFVLLIAIYA